MTERLATVVEAETRGHGPARVRPLRARPACLGRPRAPAAGAMRLVGRAATGLLLMVCAVGGWPATMMTAAQEGPTPAVDAATAPPRGDQVEELEPEIWYLRDANGSLLPAPGFRYEDFVELMRLREGLPARPRQPDAVLERISVDASIDGRVCRIEAVCDIDCTLKGWTSAYLSLDPLVLDRPPAHVGAGRFLLEPLASGQRRTRGGDDGMDPTRARPEERGYRAWFEGGAVDDGGGSTHSIRLSGVVPVERFGDGQVLRLSLPRATTSVLRLRTTIVDPVVAVVPDGADVRVEPVASPAAAVSPEAADDASATNDVPEESGGKPPKEGGGTGGDPTPAGAVAAADAAGSLVTVLGLSGPVELRLTPRGDAPAPVDRPAQVIGEVMVRIDGRKATSDVSLAVSGMAANTDRLAVTLPRGAAVTSARPPARYIGTTGGGEAARAEFAIEPSEDGAVQLEFTCESRVDASGGEPLESLAFAVDGIVGWRQWGRASVVVEGDWQVDWDPVPANRRVDPPDRGTEGQSGAQAFAGAFAYDSQPASMPLRVRPLGSRMAVEPEYRYAVGTARIELEARLRLSVRGAPVTRFEIALPGWAIDDVGPAGLVDTSRLSAESGRLLIPFARPLAGNATIELRAGRTIEADAAMVDWALPVPRADLVGPAAVTIVPQTNIELVPDADRTTGLVRQVVPQSADRPLEAGALTYRMEGSEAAFRATRRFLGRRLDATTSIRAVVDVTDTVVEETIRLDVAYLPLEIITLDVPSPVLETGSLEVRYNGLLLSTMPVPATAASAEADAEPPQQADGVRAVLPVPLLGSGELRVRYVLPTPPVPAETTVAGELPLVMPRDARLARQSLAIEPQSGLTVDVRGDQWKRDLVMQGAATSRSWTSTKPQEIVPLAIASESTTGLGETIVEATWITTRVMPDRVEDRFRYRVTSASPVLAITLPPVEGADRPPRNDAGGAKPGDGRIAVFVDGRPAAAGMQAGGRLAIELPPSARSTPRIVEIERIRPRPGLSGSLVLDPPTFANGVVERRFFWELRLESDDHVVHAPGGWNSQQAWRWTTIGPVREPVVSPTALQRWLYGSVAEPPTLAPKERRSVYSGIGPPGRGLVLLAPTWLVVLACSGPVLAVALALIHSHALRRPAVGVSLAGLCIAAAAAIPDQIPLMLMAALPGLALSAVAVVTRRMVEKPALRVGRARRESLAPSGSSTRVVGPIATAAPSLLIASSVAGRSAAVVDVERSAS